MTMGRYFTEEQLDEFMAAYVAKYPDTIERMYFLIEHSLENHDELMSLCEKEMRDVARVTPFFVAYVQGVQKEMLDAAGGEFKAGQKFRFRTWEDGVSEDSLEYKDYMKSRPIDLRGLYQAELDLHHDIWARVRTAYLQEKGE
jgi:hypothetical protein